MDREIVIPYPIPAHGGVAQLIADYYRLTQLAHQADKVDVLTVVVDDLIHDLPSLLHGKGLLDSFLPVRSSASVLAVALHRLDRLWLNHLCSWMPSAYPSAPRVLGAHTGKGEVRLMGKLNVPYGNVEVIRSRALEEGAL